MVSFLDTLFRRQVSRSDPLDYLRVTLQAIEPDIKDKKFFSNCDAAMSLKGLLLTSKASCVFLNNQLAFKDTMFEGDEVLGMFQNATAITSLKSTKAIMDGLSVSEVKSVQMYGNAILENPDFAKLFGNMLASTGVSLINIDKSNKYSHNHYDYLRDEDKTRYTIKPRCPESLNAFLDTEGMQDVKAGYMAAKTQGMVHLAPPRWGGIRPRTSDRYQELVENNPSR